MPSSRWSWDPRHVVVSRDAVRAARAAATSRDYPLLSRLLNKLEVCARDPHAGIRLTTAQVDVLADCLAGYHSTWAQEASAIIDQAIRLAHNGTPPIERRRQAEDLLARINGELTT